jgi:hypothetical protein
MAPPKGYPKAGYLTTTRAPAKIICEAPGCAAGVTVVILHTVETEDGRIDVFCNQLCDRHAAENEEAMRSVYTVGAPKTVWRGPGSEC